MSNMQAQYKDTGLAALRFNVQETQSPVFKKIVQALHEERLLLLERLAHPADIAATTLLRGEHACVKRILARTEEVGPESSQSEGDAPESGTSALAIAERFPVVFER